MPHSTYHFTAPIWVYKGKGAWFFVTLPEEDAAQIKFFSNHKRRGWGAVRVEATIGDTRWSTSIFPYAQVKSYILPIKADVRKKESITAGDTISVQLKVLV